MTSTRTHGKPPPRDRLAGAAAAVVAGSLGAVVLFGAVESIAAGELHVPEGSQLFGAAAVAGASVIVGTVGLALATGIDRLLANRSTWALAAAYTVAGLLVGAVVGIVLGGVRGAPVIFPVAGALAGVAGGFVSHRAGRLRVVAFILAGLLLALALPIVVQLAAPFLVALAAIAVLGTVLATIRQRPDPEP